MFRAKRVHGLKKVENPYSEKVFRDTITPGAIGFDYKENIP